MQPIATRNKLQISDDARMILKACLVNIIDMHSHQHSDAPQMIFQSEVRTSNNSTITSKNAVRKTKHYTQRNNVK